MVEDDTEGLSTWAGHWQLHSLALERACPWPQMWLGKTPWHGVCGAIAQFTSWTYGRLINGHSFICQVIIGEEFQVKAYFFGILSCWDVVEDWMRMTRGTRELDMEVLHLGSSPRRKYRAGVGEVWLNLRKPLRILFWKTSIDCRLIAEVISEVLEA